MLKVSNVQMIVLIEFNKSSTISVENLLATTLIPKDEFELAVQSLIQLQIIEKTGKNEVFENPDMLSINEKFNSNQKRMTCISSKTVKPTATKENQIDEELEQVRNNQLDAVLVRIMKARRTIKLNDLLSEVVKLVTLFRAQPAQIKRRVESLIERDYIKRDDGDMNLFIYLP